MLKNKSLLDKEGPISLTELKEHFRTYDPITVYSENPEFSNYDVTIASDDEKRAYNTIEAIFSDTWDQQMQVFSGRIFLQDYSCDYPVLNLKKRTQRIVSTTVMRILKNKNIYGNVMRIGYGVLKEPFKKEVEKYCEENQKLPTVLSVEERLMILDQLADQFLKRMVCLLHHVLDLQKIINICKVNDTFEDFRSISKNYRREDFRRKWYHLRARNVEVVSLEELWESEKEDTLQKSVDANAGYTELLFAFCETLDDADKQIISLSDEGYTQTEIARKLGFTSQGTISKRKQKLLEKFKKFAKEFSENELT